MSMLRPIVLALGLLAGAAAQGQIEVFLRLGHKQYLLGEAVTAEVEIRNQSGAPLIFGGTNRNARFAFDIETDSGPLGTAPVEPPLAAVVVPVGQPVTRPVNLQTLYALHNPGRYKVRACVEWGENNYCSARSFLQLVTGPEVAQLRFSPSGVASKLVKYSLRVLARNDDDVREQRLFFCRENQTTGAREAVVDLGPSLRYYDPVMQRDRAGRMHILHNSAPHRFAYSIVSADDRLLSQEYFAADVQMPQMLNNDGTITVRGRAWRGGEDRRASELLRP